MNEPIIPQIIPIPSPRIKDNTGQRFGRLVAVGYVGLGARGNAMWLCRCDCGQHSVVVSSDLRRGNHQSCGCLRQDVSAKLRFKHGQSVGKKTPEYRSWRSMMIRCYNHNHKHFSIYGGRGVQVCERWRSSFENFYADMGTRPTVKHSLDRIDSNGNYEKSNCRWATQVEQGNNRRDNLTVTYNGQTKTLFEWEKSTGICRRILYSRISKSEWPIERILTEPVHYEKAHSKKIASQA